MTCQICDEIEKKNAPVLYEDADIIAFFPVEPAAVGHVVIAPKKHVPIFEAADDKLCARMFNLANMISAAVFDSIGAKGTNLLINNGPAAGQEQPHFCINIISRQENDHLNFEWMPKQMSEEEMASIELQMKTGLERPPHVEHDESVNPSPADEHLPTESTNINTAQSEEDKSVTEGPEEPRKKHVEEQNYLLRQLKRMP